MLPLADYYVHNLNPYVFRIGGFGPRWYGIAYLLGFLCAYLLIKKLSRDGMLRLNPERIPDLVLNCCIFGVLIGGRLGYCLFYQPRLLGFTSEFPYWGVLRVWEGGMAAHGGILFTILTILIFSWRQLGRPSLLQLWALIVGTFLAGAIGWGGAAVVTGHVQHYEIGAAMTCAILWLVYYAWLKGIPAVNIGDAACMVVPVGLFFGRIANFINGELYGHPTTVPWAVKFPSEIYAPTNGDVDPRVSAALPDVVLKMHLPVDWSAADGGLAEGIQRLSTRLAAHDPDAVRMVASILPPRHPSQLYEALLEGLLLFIICWSIGRLWRKDGMASGAFLTLYPVMRIIGEQFRVGDTPIQIGSMQVSKGILYSLPMVVAGAIYWGYWIARDRRVPWTPQPADGPTDAAPPGETPAAPA